MIQYSLRDVFWGITLIAAGVAALGVWFRWGDVSFFYPLGPLIVFPLVTAGAFALVQRKALGAYLGLLFGLLMLGFLFYLYSF